MRVVSECKTPYVKQNVQVGSGVPRADETTPDIEAPEGMNDELKAVLERLQKSIKKGKPRE